MADEQYQDEDRSAAKTLWLGDVQVLASIFRFVRWLAKDCLLCRMLGFTILTRTEIHRLARCAVDPEWLPDTRVPMCLSAVVAAAVGIEGVAQGSRPFVSQPSPWPSFNRHDTPTSTKCDF